MIRNYTYENIQEQIVAGTQTKAYPTADFKFVVVYTTGAGTVTASTSLSEVDFSAADDATNPYTSPSVVDLNVTALVANGVMASTAATKGWEINTNGANYISFDIPAGVSVSFVGLTNA